ncbi:hyaluronan-binding protein 2 [Trichomycterus rosablanca]|uniref:hyaluronan-binding protein 2 n=1 Tax=Trichomycterus rosablanca TaxID=2290929 RepID=UPI002F3583A1
MLPILLLLLLSLSPDAAEKKGLLDNILGGIAEGFVEALKEIIYDYEDDYEEGSETSNDWLLDLFEDIDACDPNPCYNNGTCENDEDDFNCICPRPFKGKRCQDIINVCKNVKCGRGECVRIETEPFYECKCKAPYLPPNCKRPYACNPSPCLNGGTCVKGVTRSKFTCVCPENYSGKFCQVAPDDCYEGDGESYRGFTSETVSGLECLPWNANLIPYVGDFDDEDAATDEDDGIGPHNYCRNPDGENQPWCFIRYKNELRWDDCNVTRCPEPVSPTQETTTQAPTVTSVVTTPASKAEFSECGKPKQSRIMGKIFGGRKAKLGAHPWQVSLQVRSKNSTGAFTHNCGGILLSSCWILTAAHCIDDTFEMQVGLGGVNLEKVEAADQTVEVEDYIVHEKYEETDEALFNDIALLKLKAVDGVCAQETRFVKAACLPTGPLPDGMECTISGYGVTEKDERGSNHLLDAKVLLINQQRCQAPNVYDNVLDDSMLCAGRMQGGIDSCQGDSGGPLVCKQNETHYIYGVVSFGDSCGKKNKPGIYARVTHFIDWINKKMQST